MHHDQYSSMTKVLQQCTMIISLSFYHGYRAIFFNYEWKMYGKVTYQIDKKFEELTIEKEVKKEKNKEKLRKKRKSMKKEIYDENVWFV